MWDALAKVGGLHSQSGVDMRRKACHPARTSFHFIQPNTLSLY
jgi:hypothetical protein